MADCDHPTLYRQAHEQWSTPQTHAPHWKVVLYILTANGDLWAKAQGYLEPDHDQFDWQALLEREALSPNDRVLVLLAADLFGSGHAVSVDLLCGSLSDHNFEVAQRAMRGKRDLLQGKPSRL